MVAPIRFLSGRQQQQKIGIEGSTENQKVLEVVGRVGIGTTIFEPSVELEVRGDQIITGTLSVGNVTISDADLNVQNIETTTLNVSGVSTFQDDILVGVGATVGFGTTAYFRDNAKAVFGDNDNLAIYFDGDDSYIKDDGPGQLYIQGSAAINLENSSGSKKYFRGVKNGSAELYFDGNQKFKTTNEGVLVSGGTTTGDFRATGVSTFAGAADFNGDLDVDGHTELADVNVSGALTATSLNVIDKLVSTGIGISVLNGTSDTATIAGPSNLIIDPGVVGDNTGVVRIKGDLYVDGTQTTINSTIVEIADKVIGIATTCTSDLLTDGAGIGIGTDKTFLYEFNSGTNPSLKSSENLNVASGKGYQIDQTEVLNSTTLGNGVVNSSLTSFGILNSLSVSGVVTAATFSGNLPTTDLTGTITNAQLAGLIANSKLVNDSVSYGGVTLSLGASDATPAFDLSDATNYPYTSLTGVTTSIIGDTTPQLGGNLNLNSKTITGTGNVNITGVVTATSFVGDGSNLTGITAGDVGALAGVTIREEGSVVGSAGSIGDINFVSGNLTATASGIGATITLTDDPTFNTVNVTGVVTATTFSGSGANLTSIPNSALDNSNISFGGVSLDLGQTDATPAFDLSDATSYPYTSLTGVTTSIIGDTTPQLGGNLDINGKFITGTGGINVTGIVTATSFSGDGSNLTGITAGDVGALAGVTIREEGSVVGSAGSIGDINFVSSNLTASASGVGATITLTDDPTFNGVTVTGVVTATTFSGNLPTTDLTGTITNAQLAGSIANAKLVNDSVSFGGVSLDLGQTDATPAFDLSDATNYPTSSLSGTITNAQLAGSIADGKLASTFLKNVVEDTTPQLGGNLDFNSKFITGTGGINVTGIVTATTFSGNLPTTDLTGTITNAQLAGSIANAKLVNDSVSFGGVSVALGSSDATPAFNLSDATNYPTSSLTGTITNAQLAGSIANAKLVNDSVSFGGVSLDLGGTDATPAFDLSDATNYPTSSLSGTITNAQLAGSIADGKLASTFLKNVVEDTTPQLGGNLDFNSKFITGTGGINVSGVITATSFSGDGSNLTGINAGIGTDGSINTTGVITATSFSGDGSNLTGINAGIGTDGSINTTGVITATSFSGDGSNLTGINAGIGTDGSINTTGVITATSFSGDGSNLTGVSGDTATANQIVFKDSNNVATGSTSLTYSGTSSGIGTVGIGTVIDIVHYDNLSQGTLSWEASAGQLFSITNNLTSGSIFSVNDVSGFPSIDVDANGTIQLAPTIATEYVGIGTTNPTAKLHVVGDGIFDGTGYLQLPSGTDAQRPGSPEEGMLRWNDTSSTFEGYDGSSWGAIGGGSGDTATANQIVFKDSSNVATGSTSLTYSGTTSSGIGTVGIGTIIKNIHYDNLNEGTLSWEASAGQLFSVTNNLSSGSIFSVNDVSGVVSIDVDADGTIQLAPTIATEYVGIGTTNPTAKLHVVGDVNITSDITCSDTTKGLILTSPDGTSYRLSVANDGTLSTSAV